MNVPCSISSVALSQRAALTTTIRPLISSIGEPSTDRPAVAAVHGLRDLHLRRKEWPSALETLQHESRLWDDKREQAGILARIGEIYLHALGKVDLALERFRKSPLAQDPDCQAAAEFACFDIHYERNELKRALALGESLTLSMAREGDPESRSRFYCRRGRMLIATQEAWRKCRELGSDPELRPRNLEALDALIALCSQAPEVYDFSTVFRELEQVYRREGDQGAVG